MKPTTSTVLMGVTILLAYAVDALQDAITFTKAPQGRDLNELWHIAKYAHVLFTLTTGGLLVYTWERLYKLVGAISPRKSEWLIALAATAISLISGMILWSLMYPPLRLVDWPDWA